MNLPTTDYIISLPEIFLLSATCLILLIELFAEDQKKSYAYGLSQFTLAALIAISLFLPIEGKMLAYGGTFVLDDMANLSKIFVYIVTMLAFTYSRAYLKDRGIYKGEFYVLGLFGVLGMMVMISGHNFLTLYLGLELLSLSLYALVALDRDSARCSEAAMKYFVLGALASGMLLYGMSMLYGMTGSLDIGVISQAVFTGNQDVLVMSFGLAFLVVGLGFKLGAVPFHMWLPDVYHGAPTPVTLYLASAPKIAAFVMTMRLLVDALPGLSHHWQDMLIMLATLSIVLGNLIAIVQTNIKRMLAYSTISHVGFIILGIISGTAAGYSASLFYAVTYALNTAAGFGIILLLSRKGFEADRIEDLRGLNQRSPWYAFMMLLAMFSFAGVPPLVGFYAKLSVLTAIVSQGYITLALIAVVFSVVGAFYYLKVLKVIYFDDADRDAPAIQPDGQMAAVLSANSLSMLFLGIFPGSLMAVCAAAIS